jgi:hypothetical protein
MITTDVSSKRCDAQAAWRTAACFAMREHPVSVHRWLLVAQDLDGSLTGFAGGWTSPFYKWHLVSNACWQGGVSVDSGIICDNTAVMRRLQM